MLSIVAPPLPLNLYCSLIASLLLSVLLQTHFPIYIRNNTVTFRYDFFSATEIPHGSHEQEGIGIKWLQYCSTSSGRDLQKLWRCCYPFHHNHPFPNSISIKATCKINLPCPYNLIILFRALLRWSYVLVGTC